MKRPWKEGIKLAILISFIATMAVIYTGTVLVSGIEAAPKPISKPPGFTRGKMMQGRLRTSALSPTAPGFESSTGESLSIRRVSDLRFGRILLGKSKTGTLVIDAISGKILTSGGALNLGDDHSRAEYIVLGKPNTRFAITLPRRVKFPGKKGANVVLTNFTSSPAKEGVIGPNGEATVYMGAMLRFLGGTPSGKYEGFTDIFVDKF